MDRIDPNSFKSSAANYEQQTSSSTQQSDQNENTSTQQRSNTAATEALTILSELSTEQARGTLPISSESQPSSRADSTKKRTATAAFNALRFDQEAENRQESAHIEKRQKTRSKDSSDENHVEHQPATVSFLSATPVEHRWSNENFSSNQPLSTDQQPVQSAQQLYPSQAALLSQNQNGPSNVTGQAPTSFPTVNMQQLLAYQQALQSTQQSQAQSSTSSQQLGAPQSPSSYNFIQMIQSIPTENAISILSQMLIQLATIQQRTQEQIAAQRTLLIQIFDQQGKNESHLAIHAQTHNHTLDAIRADRNYITYLESQISALINKIKKLERAINSSSNQDHSLNRQKEKQTSSSSSSSSTSKPSWPTSEKTTANLDITPTYEIRYSEIKTKADLSYFENSHVFFHAQEMDEITLPKGVGMTHKDSKFVYIGYVKKIGSSYYLTHFSKPNSIETSKTTLINLTKRTTNDSKWIMMSKLSVDDINYYFPPTGIRP